MNLRLFLKETDELMEKLPIENLKEFVHEIARTLPEQKREDFIKTLKSFENLSDKKSVKKTGYKENHSKLLKSITEIKKKLMEINKGVRVLDSTYNEEWDDWYNPNVEEVFFIDEKHILEDIKTAINLIHSCIDMEVYKEGSELAELLSALEISVEGDYSDFSSSALYLYELWDHYLLSSDFEHLVKECLYLTYMGNALNNRAEELFCMMENFECYDIKLEEILQLGNSELPDINAFLRQWINYLGMEKSIHAEKLLQEAQGMIEDETIVLENARKYVQDHPSLYEQILCKGVNSQKDETMFAIGQEALEKIPVSYTIRGNIALLSAEYAIKQKKYDTAEQCWLEAFRSRTNVVNYLRLRCKTKDWNVYETEVRCIYEQAYKVTNMKGKSYNYTEHKPKENDLYKRQYCTLLFLDKQFDKVMQVGMSEKNALGWSSTFMKEGLALFLLLLFEGTKLQVGLTDMLEKAVSVSDFEVAEYEKGTEEIYSKNNQELFWELFCYWKKTVQISENQKEKWLDRIDKWIALRVKGIMENNHRNYYKECASFIAAFGEVRESLGIARAKSDIMEEYKQLYSRRRAFHQELKEYGMKK